jgi:sporulation protein YlmC with PRC-barrel domain
MVVQRLSDLMFKSVVDAGGKRLGHVFDVRCEVNDRARVTELVYGTHGLLASMGLREPQIKTVAWERVREVTDHEIRIG